MTLPAAVSLVTLGVRNLRDARDFYVRLGWPVALEVEELVVLGTRGVLLALHPRDLLAADAGVPPGGDGFGGVTLSVNVTGEAAVDAALSDAVAAGGRLVRAAAKAEWGGYNGYVADLDGHLLEVAYNPYWPLDEQGRLTLPSSDPAP